MRRRAAKVFEHERLTTTENLHPLLRHGLVAFGEIGDGPIRSVGEAEGDKNRIFINGGMVAAGDSFGINAGCNRAGQELHQVNEVTDFADYSATAFARVLNPMCGGNATGINPIID